MHIGFVTAKFKAPADFSHHPILVFGLFITKQNQRQDLVPVNSLKHLPTSHWLRLPSVLICSSHPIVCGGSVFGPCFVIQYFVSVKFCYQELVAML